MLKVLIFLIVFLPLSLLAGSPAIFEGNLVLLLENGIDLNRNAYILSGSTDPTLTSTLAPKGSVYLDTSNGNFYVKQDAGSSTNWINALTSSSGWALAGNAGTNPAVNFIGTTDAQSLIFKTI